MHGFSYTEVLVAIVLIAITLVPAMEALMPGINGEAIHASKTNLHYQINSKLEELLAEAFSALDSEAQLINDPTVASSVYSDPIAQTNRRLVFLSRYDGDNINPADNDPFTGKDNGLIWIRVEIEGTGLAMESLVNVYE